MQTILHTGKPKLPKHSICMFITTLQYLTINSDYVFITTFNYWVSYDVTEVTGVNSKTKHSYQSESIVRFMC
jgi:hypothetical protein